MVRLLIYLLAFPAPQDDLQTCVGFWQRQLRLEEWKISVQVVGQHDLDTGTLGDIEPDITTKTAVLRVMHGRDSDLSRRRAQADRRLTVAHEMVHLRRYADRDPKWGNEDATNVMTGELLRKHRRWFEQLAIERWMAAATSRPLRFESAK